MFEHKRQEMLSRAAFLWRLGRSFLVTVGIVVVSLLIGSCGYHFFGPMPWIDALLNSSMILTGMGPVDSMKTDAGKLFATFYALYSGIAFLTLVAVMLAPVLHRVMHKFHLDDSDE
jgi:hypothetical protein